MPRTRQGGMRAGTPGTAYQNRTDLGSQPNLPARVATNQTYGKGQSQLQAQQQVPMGPPKLALPPAPAPGPAPQPQPSPGAPPVPQPIAPGAFGDLHRPTERPFEPVTAGAAAGPGPGPEALNLIPQATNKVSDILQAAAQSTGSSALSGLAARAQAAGQ